jgi:hypothetical protein
MARTPEGVRVSQERLERFLETLVSAPLLPGPYRPRMTRTDDYPSIRISIRTGSRELVVSTESQGRDHVPWAATVAGVTYVIPDDTPARALAALGIGEAVRSGPRFRGVD